MSTPSSKPVSSGVLDAAIAWQLSLDSGGGSAQEREAFAQWHAADEEPARAWRQWRLLGKRISFAHGPGPAVLFHSRANISPHVRTIAANRACLLEVLGP